MELAPLQNLTKERIIRFVKKQIPHKYTRVRGGEIKANDKIYICFRVNRVEGKFVKVGESIIGLPVKEFGFIVRSGRKINDPTEIFQSEPKTLFIK